VASLDLVEKLAGVEVAGLHGTRLRAPRNTPPLPALFSVINLSANELLKL
jgi:hypothetical protein